MPKVTGYPSIRGGGATILDIIDQMIKQQTTPDIGDYVITAKDESPAVKWPGTVWELLPEGTFIMAAGANTPVGTTGGAASVTLTQAQLPRHEHTIQGSEAGSQIMEWSGSGTYGVTLGYSGQQGNGSSVYKAINGGSFQPHENRPPFVAANVWRRSA